jgi:hypothetical protein
VLSYAGRSFQWLSGGRWSPAWGWQELRRIGFAGLGVRWAAACDVPDLELLPLRYSAARTVEFHAALELGIQHFGLWLLAALRRAGIAVPLERWVDKLERAASFLEVFGSDRGGMLVAIACERFDGGRALLEWHLTAEASHGPEIRAWRRSCSRASWRGAKSRCAGRFRAWASSPSTNSRASSGAGASPR